MEVQLQELWRRVNFFLSTQHFTYFEHNHSRMYVFQGLIVWHSNQQYCCLSKKHPILFVPRELNKDKNQYLEGAYDCTFSACCGLRSKMCVLIYCYWLAICSDSVYVEINILDVHWHLKVAFPLTCNICISVKLYIQSIYHILIRKMQKKDPDCNLIPSIVFASFSMHNYFIMMKKTDTES